MRIIALFFLLFLMTSCGSRNENVSQELPSQSKEELLQTEYLQKGGEIVKLSSAELLQKVAQAMSSGGPVEAVDFCSVHASSIQDSLSALYNCEIKRIAIKYRNPEDKPVTETERDLLGQYQEAKLKGQVLKPQAYIIGDKVEYYHPISITNRACLLCHGNPGDPITEQTMEMILAHYPNDLATGFAMNDFRGAWKITFHHQQ